MQGVCKRRKDEHGEYSSDHGGHREGGKDRRNQRQREREGGERDMERESEREREREGEGLCRKKEDTAMETLNVEINPIMCSCVTRCDEE